MTSIFCGDERVSDLDYCGGPPLRVMSTFSGIGAASVSWQPDVVVLMNGKKYPKFEFVAYAEIEPFPSVVKESSLSRILDHTLSSEHLATYSLNSRATAGILTRSAKRGRLSSLPIEVVTALNIVAQKKDSEIR